MTIFFTADSHFSHANILKFTGLNGQLIRPGFTDVDDMDEYMIERWNSVVRDGDKVYHLGDVGFIAERLRVIMPRLRGTKRLILGNHDNLKQHQLSNYFGKIVLWRVFKNEGFVATHLPLHESSMYTIRKNIHGHIHEKEDVSPVHLNVSVERTAYTPISMEEVLSKFQEKTI